MSSESRSVYNGNEGYALSVPNQEEMPRKKKLTIKPPSQLETLKTTPSELAKQALLKSGAGAHGERRKRSRQKDRQEEIQATLEGDVEE